MIARNYRILTVGLLLALVVSLVPLGQGPLASTGDVLYNGGFENGFVANSACPGMVGAGWGCFNNGGVAVYGFYDDMWSRTVYAGSHSQLIEINTKQIGGDNNRNAGIYQTARVVPGQPYELALKGMIRADEKNTDDPWRYRVYVGFDYSGGQNWQAVSDWRELPWDTYYSRTDPGSFSSYSTQVTPSGPSMTVFVRVERKWGTWYEETDFNLDAISLFGHSPRPHDGNAPHDGQPPHKDQPVPGSYEDHSAPPAQPGDGGPAPDQAGPSMQPQHPQQPGGPGSDGYYAPPAQPGEGGSSSEGSTPPGPAGKMMPVHPIQPVEPVLVCDGQNLLRNGDFEWGFQPNGAANSWWSFTNGGRANYGFYDEQWPPVVSQGSHGQLIEINSKNLPDGTDENRVAGIAQRVWLHPGATYEFSLDAMMREEPVASDEDAYRYMVLWGYSRSGATNPAQLDFQEAVPLTKIYPRTEPGTGNMQSYSTRFQASGGYTTLVIYGLKKWATLNRELDVNLDNVVLRYCRPTAVYPVHPIYPDRPVGPVKPVHPIQPVKPVYHGKPAAFCGQPGDVWYVVQPGDTVSALAAAYNTSVQAIVAKNRLANPNHIYVGQKLCIPDPPSAASVSSEAPASAQVAAEPAAQPDQSALASNPAPSSTITTAAPDMYRIQRGDNLSSIAQRYGTTVAALMQLNNIGNANRIYAGQRIKIR